MTFPHLFKKKLILLLLIAMFAGYSETPIECIRDWMKLALETGSSFTHFHHRTFLLILINLI